MHIIIPNATTKFTISNLHKMHLTLGDDGHWVKAHIAPMPSIPFIIGEVSITQALIKAPRDMIVAQFHALFIV